MFSMKNKIILAGMCFLFLIIKCYAFPYYTPQTPVHVNGYMRSNGTYVHPYYRRYPSHSGLITSLPTIPPLPDYGSQSAQQFMNGMQALQRARIARQREQRRQQLFQYQLKQQELQNQLTQQQIKQEALQTKLLQQSAQSQQQLPTQKHLFNIIAKSAKQGNREAQYYLGTCYLQGKNVHSNTKKAVYWFQKSAKQGYGSAQFTLGILLFKGIGITKNYAEAYAWLDIATINSDIKLAKQYRNVVYSDMTQAQSKQGEKLAKQYLKKYVIPYFK